MVGLTEFEPTTPRPLGVGHPDGSRGIAKVVEQGG